MANATATELQQLYIAYFGRAADPTGLDYWTAEGTTTKAFAASMYAQAEFNDVNGSLSTEAQVNQIYQNLFDRDADADGLIYWAKQIKTGVLELASIANDLIYAVNNSTGGTAAEIALRANDKDALSNKTDAAVAYTAKVRESTAAILAYAPASSSPWVAGANITAAKTYFDGIDKDTGHTTASIAASVSTLTSNGVQTGKYTLTSDSPTITEGDTGTKTLAFTITLDRATTADTTINYETLTTGSATAADDFTATAGSVTIKEGAKVATVDVTILGDSTYENSGSAETVKIKFSGSDLAADVTATGSITENDTDPATVAQSFTLTTGTDTGSSFEGRDSANDVFDGSTDSSLDTTDSLDGKGGTDTLNATFLSSNSVRPTLAGIEVIEVTAGDAHADAVIIDTRDITGATTYTSESSDGELTLNYLAALPTININSGTDDTTINFTDAALSSSSQTLTVNLNNYVASGGSEFLAITDAGGTTNTLETVKLVTSSLASTINDLQTTAVGTTTLNISGDQDLTITTALDTEITTVSAGAFTGDLTLTAGLGATTGGVTVTTYTGADSVVASTTGTDTISLGAGNDTLGVATANLTSADTVNLGAGTDTLQTTNAMDLADADFTNVTNVETLTVATASDNMTLIMGAETSEAGISTVTMGTGTNAITVGAGHTAALTVTQTATGTDTVDASAYTGTLTVGVNSQGQGADTLTGGTGSNDTLSITAVANQALAAADLNTVTAFENVVIANNVAFSLTTDDLMNATIAMDVDATAMTSTLFTFSGAAEDDGTFNVTVGGTADHSITLGQLGDTLTSTSTGAITVVGTSGANTITLGTGADLVTLGSGNDTLTAGTGADTIKFATADLTTDDTINGGAGTDAMQATVAMDLADADFTNVTNVETLSLVQGSKNMTLIMGAQTSEAGISTVTMGTGTNTVTVGAGHTAALTINEAASGDGTTTLDASAYTGTLTVGSLDTAQTTDTLTGGTGTSDTLNLTLTDGHIGVTGDFDTITKFENLTTVGNVATNTIVTHDLTIDGGKTLTVDGTSMTTGLLTFNGSAETDGHMSVSVGGTGAHIITLGYGNDTLTSTNTAGAVTVTGTGGNNTITTAAGADLVTLGTGADTVSTGAAADNIRVAAANLTNADTIDGGAGTDVLGLTTAGSTVDSDFTNISNVETITQVTASHETTLVLGSNSQATGISTVNLGVSSTLTIGSGHTGALTINIANAASTDTIDASAYTGALTVVAHDDYLDDSTITGGTGSNDTLKITNAAIHNLTADDLDTITKFETLEISGNTAMSVTTDQNMIGAGETLAVDATSLTTAAFTFIGTEETQGSYNITVGGTGAHIITLGQAADTLTSTNTAGVVTVVCDDGANTVTTGAGVDIISSGAGVDTITVGAGSNNKIVLEATGLNSGSPACDVITDYTSAKVVINIDGSAIGGGQTLTTLDGAAFATNDGSVYTVTDNTGNLDSSGADAKAVLIVANGGSIASTDALETALEAGGSLQVITNAFDANDAFLAAYSDGTDSYIAKVVVLGAVANNAYIGTGVLSATNIFKLSGQTDVTTVADDDVVII